MSALDIIRQLASLTTPSDEFFGGTENAFPSLEEFEEDLGSDRMEDDARALWRLIDEARNCLRDIASAEAKFHLTMATFQGEPLQ